MKRPTAILVLAVALGCSSCSVILMDTIRDDADPTDPDTVVSCTSSVAAPAADGFFGTTAVIGTTAYTVSVANSSFGAGPGDILNIGLGVAATAAWFASANRGFRESKRCRNFGTDAYEGPMGDNEPEPEETSGDSGGEQRGSETETTGEAQSPSEPAEDERQASTDETSAEPEETVESEKTSADTEEKDDGADTEASADADRDVSNLDLKSEQDGVLLREKFAYTVQEASQLVDASPETIREWIASGRLEATKEDGTYRISRSELADTWRQISGEELFDTGGD